VQRCRGFLSPTTGCYTSAFPVVEWKVVACGTAPTIRWVSRAAAGNSKDQSAWQRSLLRLPRQRPGCYAASFPRVEWKTAPAERAGLSNIARARSRQTLRRRRRRRQRLAAQTPTINAIEGSFVDVSRD